MFYEVRILDGKGKLKKVLTSKMLSRRHWRLYPDYNKTFQITGGGFNAFGKAKRGYDPDYEGSGYGDY